jgi:DNA-binding HxlR family transcriptional regulator
MNEHVEFTVKAEEDLYLTGTENTIRRVTAETNYSCLMLKTQRFSSLVRHYAKYHGLRKDDLEYYFVNPLENEDTPESVQLQRGDTIMVRKRRKPEPPEPAADDEEFFRDMRELLDDDEHMDCVFLVHEDGGQSHFSSPSKVGGGGGGGSGSGGAGGGPNTPFGGGSSGMTPDLGGVAAMQTDDGYGTKKSSSRVEDETETADDKAKAEPKMVEIKAHKCILTARGEYFKALFRKGATSTSSSGETTHVAFKESTENTIRVEPTFGPKIIRLMLEFVYTNRITALSHGRISTDDLLSLLHLSDRWLLRDLKRLVEHELIRSHMDVNTVPRMYCATEDFHARRLSKACIDFIMENIREVAGNHAFQEEMKHYPHLTLPILKAAADMIPQPVHKKQRTEPPTTPGGGSGQRGHSPIADDSA